MTEQTRLRIRGWEDMSYCLECYALVPDVFFPQHQRWHLTLVQR